MKSRLIPVVLMLIGLCLGDGCQAQNSDKELLAVGDGVQVSEEELEARAELRLKQLQLERDQFEAEMARKEHAAREQTLQEMVADQLLEAEASVRQTSKQELLQSLISSSPEPTEQEIEAFWQQNQARLKGEKEQLLPQIEAYLLRQKQEEAKSQLIEQLTQKYHVQYNLEPLRFEVEVDGFPALGPKNSSVTIVEFSDFECPYCSSIGPALKKVAQEYADSVRLVFRQFPLSSIHQNAQKAAEASLCANDQEKFWELHDWMFANQKNLTVAELQQAAIQLGIEAESFNECLNSGKHRAAVSQDLQAGMKIGVTGTPALFVNGRPLRGAVDFETIAAIVEEELANSRGTQ